MKSTPRPLQLLAALAALFSSPLALDAAVGELSLSGSTWTGKVDGVTRYTGNNMAAAAAACVNNMSSGTVRIYNGGTVGGEIRLKTNVLADCWGNTLTGSGTAGIIRARNSSGTGVKNVKCAGNPWFGMYFQTSAGQTFSGISGGAGILMRIDNCAGGNGSNFNGGSPNGTSAGSHAVETMGINTATLGTVTATDRTGGCGLLWNKTSGGRVTTVNGTRCNQGGGYAGYRLANDNTNCTAGTANSVSCGRGFFALTGTNNSTTTTVNATSCRDVGVWIQDVVNVKVNGGTVKTTPSCKWVSGSGSYANVSCQ